MQLSMICGFVFISLFVLVEVSCEPISLSKEIQQNNPLDEEEFQDVAKDLAVISEIATELLLGREINNSISNAKNATSGDSQASAESAANNQSINLANNNTYNNVHSNRSSMLILQSLLPVDADLNFVIPSPPDRAADSVGFTSSAALNLFEGDIVLSRVQSTMLVTNLQRRRRRKQLRVAQHDIPMPEPGDPAAEEPPGFGPKRVRRKVYDDLTARWPVDQSIQYKFDPTLDESTRTLIRNAVHFWDDNTCLSFRYEEFPGQDYIHFFEGQGCYSMIGRAGGKQGISIGSGCRKFGVITHELGHALGLWHEQSRPDCHKKIRILPQNIIPIFMSNFLHRDANEIQLYNDVPYDVGSVMHYGPQAFTSNWRKNTIETIFPGFQRVIGQREQPSFFDIKAINKAYCPGRCVNFPLQCRHGSYPHPGSCRTCLCPAGLMGTSCDVASNPKNARCGGNLPAANFWQAIESPGYGPDGDGYKKGQECTWLLKLFCTKTCLDYVEVKNGTDFSETGMRFCCFDTPTVKFVSATREMLVMFRATASTDLGFQARFRYYPDDPINSRSVHPGVTRGQKLPPRNTHTSAEGNIITFRTVNGPAFTRAPTPIRGPKIITGKPFGARVTKKYISSNRSPRPIPNSFPIIITGSPVGVNTFHQGQRSTTSVPVAVTPNPQLSWADWSGWSACSRSCGACGLRSRSRYCAKNQCRGERLQFRRCAFKACAPECSINFQLDSTCSDGDEKCLDDKVQHDSLRCSEPRCCSPYRSSTRGFCLLDESHNSSWSNWGAWGPCQGANCGGCARQIRYRACEVGSCFGNNSETRACNIKQCNPLFCYNGQNCACCKPLLLINGHCVNRNQST